MRIFRSLVHMLVGALGALLTKQPPLPRIIKYNLHPFMKRAYGKVLAGGRGLSLRTLAVPALRVAVVLATLGAGAALLTHYGGDGAGVVLAIGLGAVVIPQLQEQRAQAVERMEEIVATAEQENRDLSEAEIAEFEQLKEEKRKLDVRISRAEEVEAARAELAARQAPAAASRQSGSDTPSRQATVQISEADRGLVAARITRALAAGRGDPRRAMEWLERHGVGEDDLAFRALAAGDLTDGGFFITPQHDPDVIELLRPASVIRQLEPTILPMGSGILNLPKLTGGATAGYIGENSPAPKSQPKGGLVNLTAKKLAALVPISNDLIRRPSRRADQVVRDDMFAACGQRSDLAFIRGDGTGATPKGLRHWAPADNVIPANGTVNLQNVVADLGKMVLALETANVRMIRPGWVMSPRTKLYLMTVQDGNGNYVFRAEMLEGRLWGWPYRSTSQIPDNLGQDGKGSELYLADFADVVIGESEGILIDVSNVAAYHDGNQVVAAFSNDQTVIRAIMEHDLALRHEESVAVLTGVKWGAS